jgi:hypothetical protein
MALRLALVLALIAVTAATPLAAQAGDVRASLGITNDRRPPAGAPSVGVPGDPRSRTFDARRPDRRERTIIIIPQIVFVSPGRCWQSGYWSYQWMPQSYSYTTWVPGQWSDDGSWIDAHYEPGWYSSGYYQPLWVEGYWIGC